ncbi:MAG: substrate-binding domain-containing protein [Anaerolineae bacterium]|nr:substrate-binding domain-containing protein [Anaerolineae bacterium]
MTKTRKRKKPSGPTLGLLVSLLERTYHEPIWHGVMDTVQGKNVNLFCFMGGQLTRDPEQPPTIQRNMLYDFITPTNVDGLIVVTTSIAAFTHIQGIRDFCDRYRPVPIISVGVAVPGIPSIVVDNTYGIREAMKHFIEVHDRRRIAFVRGPQGQIEAELRYQAYVAVLAEYDIPLDPTLVAPGDFMSGHRAAQILLDVRRASFDAVLVANDNMAIGMLHDLQTHGIRVPDDVAIIGFDDTLEARLVTPQLTSVRQPIYELGVRATETMLSKLQEEPVAECTMLPTTLSVRRSCGCPVSAPPRSAIPVVVPVAPHETSDPHVQCEAVTAAFLQTTQYLPPPLSPQQARALVDAFCAAMKTGVNTEFITALDMLTQTVQVPHEDPRYWQKVLDVMRQNMLPMLGRDCAILTRAGELWLQAQQYVNDIALRGQGWHALYIERQCELLQQIGESLIAMFDVAQLTNTLKRELPRLDIHGCVLSLYEDPAHPEQYSRMILAHKGQQSVPLPPETAHYPTQELIPDAILTRFEPHNFVVEPLLFQNEPLGLGFFAVGSREGRVYETLGRMLSSALKGALLLDALQEAYEEVETHVEERTSELQREVSERQRAEKMQTFLYRISEATNSAQGLQELFHAIHRIINEMTTVDNFYIALYNAQTDAISFPYFHESRSEKMTSRSAGKQLTEHVIRSRKPLLATPETYPGLIKEIEIQTNDALTTNWLGVPLVVQDQPIGALVVENYPPGVGFSEEEKHVLLFISTQVAMAIERVQAAAERGHLLATLQQRNTQLQTAAEVSKSAITILDPDRLIQQAVHLIQERFKFYYVGLFLVDEDNKYAVLHAGTGDPGRKMLEAGHKLRVGGSSMIGWCTAHGEARIALDVGEEAIRFDNPLLPLTRSEMALPLISHSQGCIGGLSVQSMEAAAFSEEDIAVLQTMTDHLAIAIENARLYDQVQRHATELEHRVAERTAELVAINKELESFSYSVSHDLRAPLRSIDGFSQALLEDYHGQLDEMGRDYLQRVRKASQRMGQLIDGLLNLSRLTRGEMYRQPVNLSTLAAEIAQELQGTDLERQVTFVIAPNINVQGDVRLLRAALQNLLGNAWKFTGGRADTRIEFGVLEKDGKPAYFVHDNGVGFDMTYADKLFSAFQRLHSTSEFEGNGIGLATVQRIIHRHGGLIWAESALNEGATFYFTLQA